MKTKIHAQLAVIVNDQRLELTYLSGKPEVGPGLGWIRETFGHVGPGRFAVVSAGHVLRRPVYKPKRMEFRLFGGWFRAESVIQQAHEKYDNKALRSHGGVVMQEVDRFYFDIEPGQLLNVSETWIAALQLGNEIKIAIRPAETLPTFICSGIVIVGVNPCFWDSWSVRIMIEIPKSESMFAMFASPKRKNPRPEPAPVLEFRK